MKLHSLHVLYLVNEYPKLRKVDITWFVRNFKFKYVAKMVDFTTISKAYFVGRILIAMLNLEQFFPNSSLASSMNYLSRCFYLGSWIKCLIS